ncbi:hypothetical protein IW492_09495 [Enterococcus sp. BWB1-3]|uniref:hypothetical protein n=1 Tax=Enterococcus sp. BWB1-3 TaxID=2787713 RepID=UPI001920DD6F|nr:hypothetical protein [Enterococcus sp. BWB1-3]MBL1229464.1 hypothetical protein [Enterococcus sp. BWB1-3]
MFFNKRIIHSLLVLLLGCGFLVACDGSSANKLSSEDNLLIWSENRDKSFPSYDIGEMTKEEAEELMKEKLQLMLTEAFKNATGILTEQLTMDNQTLDYTQYYSQSSAAEVDYSEYLVFKTSEGYYPISAQVEIKYTLDKGKKTVSSTREAVVVKNIASTEQFNGKDQKKLISQLASAYNISENDFSMKLSELSGKYNETIYLYDTLETAKEDESLGKRIYVKFADNGVVSIIGLVLEDFRK